MQLGQLFRDITYRIRGDNFCGSLDDADEGILIVDVAGDSLAQLIGLITRPESNFLGR